MKPNKRKWEELLEDPSLEKRVLNSTKVRYKKERNRNRFVVSVAFTLAIGLAGVSYTSYISPADELSTNVSMLLEELDSNPFLYLGGD